jgi:O-antigen/teichoic acid export membrane protein
VLGYVPFLQLGVLNGLNRELPYYIGKGDREHAHDLTASAQAWALLVGGSVASVLLCVAVWQGMIGKINLAAGWGTFAAGAFFLFYSQNYLQVTYRTRGDFARLTFVNVSASVAGFFLVGLVWLFSFYGLCLRTLGISLVTFALLWRWRPVRVKPKWIKAHLVHLFKIGFPIFVVGQLYAWWFVLNSTLVLKFMDAKALGLFQLSVIVLTTIEMLPGSLGQIAYPRMASDFGQHHSLERLIQIIRRPIILMFLAMIPVVVLGWFAIPLLVNHFLPNYSDGIQAAQWSLVAGLVLSLSPLNNIFNVIKCQRQYAVAILIGMLVYCISLFWLAKEGIYLAVFPQALIFGRTAFLLSSYFFVMKIRSTSLNS